MDHRISPRAAFTLVTAELVVLAGSVYVIMVLLRDMLATIGLLANLIQIMEPTLTFVLVYLVLGWPSDPNSALKGFVSIDSQGPQTSIDLVAPPAARRAVLDLLSPKTARLCMMNSRRVRIALVSGLTCSGKTALATIIGRELEIEKWSVHYGRLPDIASSIDLDRLLGIRGKYLLVLDNLDADPQKGLELLRALIGRAHRKFVRAHLRVLFLMKEYEYEYSVGGPDEYTPTLPGRLYIRRFRVELSEYVKSLMGGEAASEFSLRPEAATAESILDAQRKKYGDSLYRGIDAESLLRAAGNNMLWLCLHLENVATQPEGMQESALVIDPQKLGMHALKQLTEVDEIPTSDRELARLLLGFVSIFGQFDCPVELEFIVACLGERVRSLIDHYAGTRLFWEGSCGQSGRTVVSVHSSFAELLFNTQRDQLSSWVKSRGTEVYDSAYDTGDILFLQYLETRPSNEDSLIRSWISWKVSFREPDWTKVDAVCRKASRIASSLAPAWFGLGLAAVHAGNKNEAERAFQTAVDKDSGLAQARFNLGVLLAERGKKKAAEDVFRAAVKAEPAFADAWYNLGVLLLKRGEKKAAEDAFMAALKADSELALAWYSLGVVLKDRGASGVAEKAFRGAVRADSQYAQAWYNLGVLLHNRGELEEAETDYRKAVKIDPRFAQAWTSLGMLLIKRGEKREAENAYRKAVEADDTASRAWTNLGVLLHEREELKEAEIAYRKAVEADDNDSKAWFNLGNLANQRGGLEEAEKAYRKALEADSANTPARFSLGVVLLELGDVQSAFSTFKDALFEALKTHGFDVTGSTGLLGQTNSDWTVSRDSRPLGIFWIPVDPYSGLDIQFALLTVMEQLRVRRGVVIDFKGIDFKDIGSPQKFPGLWVFEQHDRAIYTASPRFAITHHEFVLNALTSKNPPWWLLYRFGLLSED